MGRSCSPLKFSADTVVGMALPALGNGMSWLSPSPPPDKPSKGRGSSLLPSVGGRTKSLGVSTGLSLLIDKEWKPASCLTPLWGGAGFVTVLRLAACSPHSALAGEYRWGQRFSVSLCLEQRPLFSAISCLAKLPVPGPFAGGADFKKCSFICLGRGPSCSPQDLSLPHAQTLSGWAHWLSFSLTYGILAPRPGSSLCPLHPWGETPLALFWSVPTLLVFPCYWVLQLQIYILGGKKAHLAPQLYVLCVYAMGFLVALSDEIGKYVHSIFPESNVSLHILKLVAWKSVYENSKDVTNMPNPLLS